MLDEEAEEQRVELPQSSFVVIAVLASEYLLSKGDTLD
jgi:hypothetical protein